MRTRWWLAAIWAAFAVRLAFYATAFPIWEGFDEWAHFAVVRQVAQGHVLAPRNAVVPLDVAASLQSAPIPPTISNLPGEVVTHEQYWKLPADKRAEREAAFHTIPNDFRWDASRIGAYEALQPPLYYWLMAPLLYVLRYATLATQLFALRWAAVLLITAVIPLIFLIGREVFRDDRLALGCAAAAALMPELAISSARVSNECIAIPIYTAVTWVVLRRRNWVALGVLLGLGLLTKAYFLAALAGAMLAFWSPRALLLAAGISGWWYARNYFTTGTVSGLSEAVALQGTSWGALLEKVDTLPWLKAIDSILFSHLYFGGWSSLMVRSWMYHLLFLGIGVAGLALIGVRKNPQVRSLLCVYGLFWAAQLYNTALIYATKNVPTSMGWYLYAVVGAEVMLGVIGLRRVIGRWALGSAAIALALLDLYAMNAVALPYYTGLLGRKANGALAAVRISDVHFVELFRRLSAFKPEYVTSGCLIALWVAYLAATIALVVAAMRLGWTAEPGKAVPSEPQPERAGS